ncbi:kelch repeat-containing protein [Ekhidna sp.]|uniref:Kelch repeat-containing protein n=1 Tax=Ekhidna sp. TaxID=2608089 RepID=UPI003299A324
MNLILKLILGLSMTLIYNIEMQKPYPRNQPVVAYHTKLQSVFLFGGFDSNIKMRSNDLWSFNGKKWSEWNSDEIPEPRNGHAMIYDEHTNRLVLFGGKTDNGNLLNDTWIWTQSGWQELSITGPEARQSHRILPTKDGIILFGGSDSNGNSLNDTWILQDSSWRKVETKVKPPSRRQHTLAYNSAQNSAILFGGFDRLAGEKIIYGDTWMFEHMTWKKVNESPELGRDHHAMAYDKNNKAIILFGGYNKGYLGDTRLWNGYEWVELTSDGPSPRAGKPGLFYDSKNEAVVLFGGWDATNKPLIDFWKFDLKSKSWTQL